MKDSNVFAILKRWCDRLLELQVSIPSSTELDGAILCPACGVIHGRFADLCYPLVYLWRETGEERYLLAAEKAVDWTENNLVMPSGLWRNDISTTWYGISVFGYMALYDALETGGDALPERLKTRWNAILDRLQEAIYIVFSGEGFYPNVNYYATCSTVMNRAYLRSGNEKYLASSRHWSDVCLEYVTSDGMLCGEGSHGRNVKTARGFRSVDLGYNAEESLPSLLLTARERHDPELDRRACELMDNLLNFMLPDGGLDNSWGSRAAKWTYYGSRTSDGIQTGLILHPKNAVWMEAAYRSFALFEKLTVDNLLAGGFMHEEAGQPACVHHAFTHAKVLAHMCQSGLSFSHQASLPSDSFRGIRSFPDCGIHLVGADGLRASVYTGDHTDDPRQSALGGSMTLLWSETAGAVFAATMNNFYPVEPHNMQLLKDGSDILTMTPRLQHGAFSNVYDGDFHTDIDRENLIFRTVGRVKTAEGKPFTLESGEHASYEITHAFSANKLTITIKTGLSGAVYHLPVICTASEKVTLEGNRAVIERAGGRIEIQTSAPLEAPYGVEKRFFNPVGGFDHVMLAVSVPENGVCITVSV